MEADYDIVIIGGGLVGASLACALAPQGLRVAVVEAVPFSAERQPSYDVQGSTNAAGGRTPGAADDRTLALAYGARRIFEGLGVWGEIERLGAVPIRRIHISDRGHFGFARLSAADLGREALGYVVETRALGAALLAALRREPNVTQYCPARMTSLETGTDAVTVAIEHEGRVVTLRARLVIGADGADSAVRAAAGIGAERIDYGQSAIVTTVSAARGHDNVAYERFTGTGPLALLPMSEHRGSGSGGARCAVVWSARHEEVAEILGWSDGQFLARLQERFGDRLGRLTRVGRRVAYPLRLTRVTAHVRPRLALIGNAAHTVHPVAGQGFNLGLRDVARLAEVLVDAARAGEDIGALPVLERYARERVRDHRVTQGFTHSLIRVFANDAPPFIAARNLGLLAVDLLPPLKRAFVRVTSGMAGRLPRLARGLPL
jgi:2-octaprenyl-6-methoxyphenol hydroxylase